VGAQVRQPDRDRDDLECRIQERGTTYDRVTGRKTMKMTRSGLLAVAAAAAGALGLLSPLPAAAATRAVALTDQQIDELVRHSYQYVAMYNVNNKFAMKQGGWNTVVADTTLKDHTVREIARPNNDTLYISAMVDLRNEPMILEMPAFDSDYVSLMITGYDHYVNIPMSTRLGDFGKPERMLLYTARTKGYDGKPVAGVSRVFEASGDFVSAVLRVMPHANDRGRFQRILGQMKAVRLMSLSELRAAPAKPVEPAAFPPVGRTDADTFGNNLLEVMQFVFNHTTFGPNDALDRKLVAIYKPLGVVPGRSFDPAKVAKLDGASIRTASERVFAEEMARALDPKSKESLALQMFKPKGQMTLEALVNQSVLGPIGLPAAEAVYPPVTTADGSPMNAMHDYVIRMNRAEMPPAGPFWSATLYDTKNGFFIPNDRKKYSVGLNAGMKLDEAGGIEIYVAAQKPQGAPEQNWLPIVRKDENIDVILRIYVPDLEKFRTWKPPVAERLKGN
jgi:hypothetical protein